MEILLEPSVLPVGDFGSPRAKFLQRWSLWYAAINDSCARLSWSRNLGDDVDGRGRSFPLISLNVDHRLQVPKMATALELGVIAVAHLLLAGGLSQSEVWYVRTMQSVFAWLCIRWISLTRDEGT